MPCTMPGLDGDGRRDPNGTYISFQVEWLCQIEDGGERIGRNAVDGRPDLTRCRTDEVTGAGVPDWSGVSGGAAGRVSASGVAAQAQVHVGDTERTEATWCHEFASHSMLFVEGMKCPNLLKHIVAVTFQLTDNPAGERGIRSQLPNPDLRRIRSWRSRMSLQLVGSLSAAEALTVRHPVPTKTC